MRIVHIQYPNVITDEGLQIPIELISGSPKVGSEIRRQDEFGSWYVTAVTSDSECVNGVCPVR